MYRTNCGATCAFGAVLRHERRHGPLLVVRRLVSEYPAETLAVHLGDARHAIVDHRATPIVLRSHVLF